MERPSSNRLMSRIKHNSEKLRHGLKQLRHEFALSISAESTQDKHADSAAGFNYRPATYWPSGPYDTVLVNDKSASMGTKDYRPSRLEGSKKAAEQFIRLRAKSSPDDRVAIVAFTESAETIVPLASISETATIISKLKTLKATDGTDIAAGLRAAKHIFLDSASLDNPKGRFYRTLLLTDDHGGKPLKIANELKHRLNVLVEVIGIGGKPSAVNEKLLRKVATTDPDGFTHYWFIRDSDSLITHYSELATGLAWKGKGK